MSYKDEVVKAFKEDIVDRGMTDDSILNIIVHAFSSGFEYGSLNGASDEIKSYVVEKMKPIKDKKAREIVEKLRNIME